MSDDVSTEEDDVDVQAVLDQQEEYRRQQRQRQDSRKQQMEDRDRVRQEIRSRAKSEHHDKKLIRVDHPSLPPVGNLFVEFARRIEGIADSAVETPKLALTHLVREALYSPGHFVLPAQWGPNKSGLFRFVPGHPWRQTSIGPTPSDVMVIGKLPGREEIAQRRTLAGPTGAYLAELLEKLMPDGAWADWYVTNIVKHLNPEQQNDKALPPLFVANCRHLLFQELAIVRPKFILCLGSDAAKALFGNSATITKLEGQILNYALPGNSGKAQAMVVIHPAQVLREPHREIQLETNLYRFVRLVRGEEVFENEENRDYRVIDTEEELVDWVAEVRAYLKELSDPILAVDAEWHGDHPQNHGSYLRTVQVAWDEGRAAAIRLRRKGGWEISPGWEKRALDLLAKRLFPGVRVCGHFFNADLEMLVANGLDLRRNFLVPAQPKGSMAAWNRTRSEGGFDTALAAHAIDETGRLKLELLALRYTNMRRWDGELRSWVEAYCKEHGLTAETLEGYGECPDSILLPYSMADVDATLRLYRIFQRLLDKDHRGLFCRKAFWHSMVASPGVYEINTTGIMVDRARLDQQHDRFQAKFLSIIDEIRQWARWPEFNLNSPFHVRELLFGPEYSGKYDENGDPISVAPENAQSLGLFPVFDTSKRPVLWEKIVAEGRERQASASTGKSAMSILYYETEDAEARRVLGLIRDAKFVGQTLKFTLRPPAMTAGGTPIRNAEGHYVYTSGFGSFIGDDGCVRTTMLQTAETGRWKSARPPLQNFCLDRQTELLTERGWVPMDRVTSDYRVAQYWPQTATIDFVPPLEVLRFPHRGEMCHVRNRQIDLMMTPNHRCLFRSRKTGKYFERMADQFAQDVHHLHAGVYAGGSESLSAARVGWLCAVQADGSFVKNGGVVFTFSKERKVRRLERWLKELDVPYRLREPVEDRPRWCLYVGIKATRGRELVAWTEQKIPAKKWGPWLLQLDRQTLDLLSQEVFHWDGLFTRKNKYSSSDRENADWIQIVWTLSGQRARMRPYRNKLPKARVHWCVNTPIPSRKRDCSVTKNLTQSRVPWDDEVFCVRVPSSYIVVRRNGKVSVTGNSKSREADYARILGDQYLSPVRSVFRARPGHVLLEFDFKGAELFITAVMSGDPVLIDHVTRNKLPENDPNYVDIHSTIAVKAFHLDCPPTKSGLKSLGKEALRTAAKTVIFGLFYGRQAKAIAIGCREQGVSISTREAQQLLDTIFATYPNLHSFFEACQDRAIKERWLCSCMGRLRRFPATTDFGLMGDFQRQAMNFPIQGAVADVVNLAISRLRRYRASRDPNLFRIILQIHDAIMLEVPYQHVKEVVEKVVPICAEQIPVYQTTLEGIRVAGAKPYYLSSDIEIAEFWGEKLSDARKKEIGLVL